MTDVATSLPIEEPSSEGVTALMDDEAYLMTMVEADSLLPSNMTFSGLFEGDNELNPDELSDIASLLAPEVSDDEAAGSDSSRVNSPTPRAATPITTDAAGAPIFPKLETSAVVSPTAGKRTVLQGSSAAEPSQKKPKLSPKSKARKINLKPKPVAAASASASVPFPSLSKSEAATAPNPLTGTTETKPPTAPTLPTLAPKPASAVKPPTTKSLPSVVIQKTTSPTASASIKAAIAPSNDNKAAPEEKPTPDTAASTEEDTPKPAPSDTVKPLTEDERAQQCRDRNRQHARNTRLRKKAYVEELKRQLRDMVDQRDANALEESQKAKIVEQQREVRFQVMQDFLQLRGRNEGNPARWGAILEEGFSLTLPKTNFQTMVPSTETGPNQTLNGVPDIMEDATYFATFLEMFATSPYTHTTHPSGDDTNIPNTTFVYQCDRDSFLMDGCNAMLNWKASSTGAVKAGALRELELCGSMRARFCGQTNRLEKAEIQFDTGLIRSQL